MTKYQDSTLNSCFQHVAFVFKPLGRYGSGISSHQFHSESFTIDHVGIFSEQIYTLPFWNKTVSHGNHIILFI